MSHSSMFVTGGILSMVLDKPAATFRTDNRFFWFIASFLVYWLLWIMWSGDYLLGQFP